MNLIHGCSLEKLKDLADNSIDSVVTDPPYGLSFMGKKWDYDVPSVELWKEVLRVLKPGGHLLSFGGTRTYHRMVVNIEDAGFEIRDQIQWLYGSGFPKSTDVSKRIDKEAGAEREVLGVDPVRYARLKNQVSGSFSTGENWEHGNREVNITAPATDQAKQWQGFGTALKPANEPICMARKPLEKGLTVAQNVLKWGVGAINIDGSRIGSQTIKTCAKKQMYGTGKSNNGKDYIVDNRNIPQSMHQGRWPANLILDETAAELMDLQADQNVSRFFYVAKASKSERNRGLSESSNGHPTVKPVKLMEYLVRLVTPPQGTCLDPFMGSGTTGVACKRLGFDFIGIEREAEYIAIATKRISSETQGDAE